MDVNSQVFNQEVPHWAEGVPLIQVVTPASPDVKVLLVLLFGDHCQHMSEKLRISIVCHQPVINFFPVNYFLVCVILFACMYQLHSKFAYCFYNCMF